VSSRRSLPCSTSWAIATAVNILFIEARLNFVFNRFGTRQLRSARPYAVEDHASALRHQDHAGELVPLCRPGKVAADLVQHRGFRKPARGPDIAPLDCGVPHRDGAVVTELLGEARIREGPDPRPVIAKTGLDQDLQRIAPFGLENLESPALLRYAGQPGDTISHRNGLERFPGDVGDDERGLRRTVTGVDRLDQFLAQAADRGCGKVRTATARGGAHLGGDDRTRRCAGNHNERETQVRHRFHKPPQGKRKGRSETVLIKHTTAPHRLLQPSSSPRRQAVRAMATCWWKPEARRSWARENS
jgi:hypothetical protein